MKSILRVKPLLSMLCVLALSGCYNAPAPAVVVRADQATATIESVDMVTRQVLLTMPDGSHATFIAGPDVKNLAQVRQGDRVTATYRESVAVRLAMPGTPPPDGAMVASDRAAAGEMPGGATAGVITARVTFISATPDGSSVSFTGPAGVNRVVAVRDPQMRAFVRKLKVGDQVDVGYAGELVIDVRPM